MIPKRLSRDIIYESEWVSLYADKVQFADGHIIDRMHQVHFDYESVAMVIQNDKDEILLIKSYRYHTQSEEWEIPAGRVDSGESSVKAAVRETLEETGYSVENPTLIYKYNPTNGISNKVFAIYKAFASKQEGLPDPHEVHDMKWISKGEIVKMLRQNEIRCGLSLVGLMLVLFCE